LSFAEWLDRWNLIPDGDPIVTRTGRLLPVLRAGEPAILKISIEDEERWGAGLMNWWDGEGAARVLALEGEAVLLERAVGGSSLGDMACRGRDDQATRIICRVAARLHAPRQRPLPELVTLPRWFAQLEPAAAKYGGVLRRAATVARYLLAEQRDVTVLHGDLHHGNVLDFGRRGWLAIDPKRLHGERTFDFVNILRNPNAEVALSPARFDRQVSVIARAAGLDRARLLEWSLAFTGLSAAWSLDRGDDAALDLALAKLAEAKLAA
jgi:streptomycin 6-kinase